MSDILEKLLFLQGVDIFSNLTIDELRMIAGITEREHYSDNEYLFRQGDPGNYAYIMVSGKVELFFENAGREVQPLMTVGEGACFGEMALLDGEPRSAGARTLTESVISKISRNDFIQTITRHPAIALGIISQLSYRLRITNTKTNKLTSFVTSFQELYQQSAALLGDEQ